MFFKENENLFLRFINEPPKSQSEDSLSKLHISEQVIIWMVQMNITEDNCAYSIETKGESFIEDIQAYLAKEFYSETYLDKIYVHIFRFLYENDLNSIEETSIFSEMIRKITEKEEGLSPEIKSEMNVISLELPLKIYKRLSNNEHVTAFKNFENKVKEADEQIEKNEQLKSKWDSEIEEKKLEVEKLQKDLKDHKTGINFVALNEGFQNLLDKKIDEEKSLLHAMSIMGLLIILPLFFKIFFGIIPPVSKLPEASDFTSFSILFAMLSLELILIYFFRIILSNYKSVKAQIIQIELRQTLCGFIQGYADFRKDLKETAKENGNPLEKFENLIFSGIITESDKLPSTFDGMEQLGGLIKAVKTK